MSFNPFMNQRSNPMLERRQLEMRKSQFETDISQTRQDLEQLQYSLNMVNAQLSAIDQIMEPRRDSDSTANNDLRSLVVNQLSKILGVDNVTPEKLQEVLGSEEFKRLLAPKT